MSKFESQPTTTQLNDHASSKLIHELQQALAAEKQRSARMAAINAISRLMTTKLQPDQLLKTAVVAITEHLPYEHVALLTIDPQIPDQLTLQAGSGAYTLSELSHYTQPTNQGLIGLAVQAKQTILINDVRRDSRYIPIPDQPDIQAELAVPIIDHDQVLGVLNIESTQPFTLAEAADIELLAEQLGAAINRSYVFDATHQALNEAQLLYQTSQKIGMALTVDNVIDAYLEHIAIRDQYACNVTLYDFDEKGEREAIVVWGRWTPDEGLVHVQERYPYIPDTLDPLLDRGETITIPDVFTDPRVPPQLREIQQKANRPAIALIPIMTRLKRIGLVVLSYPQIHHWPQESLTPYHVTTAQLAGAIDSRRQHKLVVERGQQLAVLEERQRLARDLHDSITQLIFSITLIAQSISPAWQRSPAEGEQRANRLIELSKSALAEMRALLAELRPTKPASETSAAVHPNIDQTEPNISAKIKRLQQQGLATALRHYVDKIDAKGLQVQIDIIDSDYLTSQQFENLYRIAQEALNNVVKHAEATLVTITLTNKQNTTRLVIIDDGVGFEQSGLTPPIGLGLQNMKERATELGGSIHFQNAPNRGTQITVVIPKKG